MKDQVTKYMRRANARRTKSQIADALGCKVAPVSSAVNTLVGEGVLTVAGEVKGSRGRPSVLFRIAR